MLGIGCIPLWLAEFSTRSNTCQKTMKEMHKYSGSCYWEAITRPFLTKIGSKNVCGLWIMDYGCIILGVIRLAREREKKQFPFFCYWYIVLYVYIYVDHIGFSKVVLFYLVSMSIFTLISLNKIVTINESAPSRHWRYRHISALKVTKAIWLVSGHYSVWVIQIKRMTLLNNLCDL